MRLERAAGWRFVPYIETMYAVENSNVITQKLPHPQPASWLFHEAGCGCRIVKRMSCVSVERTEGRGAAQKTARCTNAPARGNARMHGQARAHNGEGSEGSECHHSGPFGEIAGAR